MGNSRNRHRAALPLAGRATIFSSTLIIVVAVVRITVALGQSSTSRAWRLLDIEERHGDENRQWRREGIPLGLRGRWRRRQMSRELQSESVGKLGCCGGFAGASYIRGTER